MKDVSIQVSFYLYPSLLILNDSLNYKTHYFIGSLFYNSFSDNFSPLLPITEGYEPNTALITMTTHCILRLSCDTNGHR